MGKSAKLAKHGKKLMLLQHKYRTRKQFVIVHKTIKTVKQMWHNQNQIQIDEVDFVVDDAKQREKCPNKRIANAPHEYICVGVKMLC